MIRDRLLILCFFLVLGILSAQEPISMGSIHKIHSKNLDLEIELQVYLPKGYEVSEEAYPTLYILDGQWFFTSGVAIQESMRGDKFMPKMIVVGINMINRPYRSKLFDRWDAFIEFLETEMVSYVNQSFRTSDQRIIFGWENSGYLTSELILRKDSPFQCAIASNGIYIDKDYLESLSIEEERFLFIAGSKKDIYSIDGSDQASEILQSVNPEKLNWEYRLFNEEIHESLAYTALYQGLKFYYHNYGSLVFSSIDEFYEKGGMSFLNRYFKKRSERFGFPPEIDASTKNSLIWLAWSRDNFEAFDLFMNEFEDVLSTPRYASAYWQNRLAQFYLKNGSSNKAIEYFTRGINEYPDDRFLAQMHHGLGKAQLNDGDKKSAKLNLKKAIEIAEKASGDKLEYYKEELRKAK